MDGLMITHDGKRYFFRPEMLELCKVSDADLQELQKHQALPNDPIVPMAARERELSEEDLSQVAGGTIGITHTTTSTVMCPSW